MRLRVSVEEFPPLTESGRRYVAWARDESGEARRLGVVDPAAGGSFRSPGSRPVELFVTVESGQGSATSPSEQELIGGEFRSGRAELDVNGYLTPGDRVLLEEEPGTHVLFTPSDNRDHGFPSDEDAGIWVFNIRARDKPARETCRESVEDSDFFLDMTPLSRGWTYEGWVVRDVGSEEAVWLSYGKFSPDRSRKLNRQDNTGLGPFSGFRDFVDAPFAREHCFPGDDWVENPFGLELPAGLEVPIDLNGRAHEGVESRWTHVITIEPAYEREKESPERGPAATLRAEPFGLRPYRNPIGEAPPDVPRTIEFVPEELPSGTATLEPGTERR